MKSWLKALFAETRFAWWTILSAISTVSTFFVPTWSGKLRLLFSISAAVAFCWANFRVFQKQQIEIANLKNGLATHEHRASNLIIIEEPGSRYILTPIQNIPRADFMGGHFEFRLMIENTGLRNSTVTHYRIEIPTLSMTFDDIQPIEGRSMVAGRTSQMGIDNTQVLSKTRTIHIPAETMTNRGTLFFQVPDITLQQFLDAGMRMAGPERRFGELRCRLTLTDTTHNSATHEFTLIET